MAERFPFPQQNFKQHISMPIHNPGGNLLHYPTLPQWQQHQVQRQQQLLEDQKHREYLKQQQKLRLISSSANKAVSADKLIENLLEKKETFQLKPSTSNNASHNQMAVHPAGITGTSSLPSNYVSAAPTTHSVCPQSVHDRQKFPSWLSTCSNSLPPIYSHVWSLVVGPNALADTARLFPILITSGLTADVLGHIWSLANKEVPGQLTELELYTVLALIAVAQNGCPFSSLGVLNLIPQAPVPNLNVGVMCPTTATASSHLPGSHSKMKREELNLKLNSEPNCSSPGSVPKEMKTENEESIDDFTDFQSFTVGPCVTETVVNTDVSISDKLRYSPPDTDSLVQKNHSLNTENITQKCPNVVIVGNTSHSRGIGSRLANHSLGAPKQSKMRHKHHHHHHHHSHKNNQHPINSVSPTAEDEFTDFQQAGTSVSETNMSSVTSPSGTYVLKESAIRAGKKLSSVINRLESSSEMLKDRSVQSKDFVTSVSDTETISPNYDVINTRITKRDLEKPVVHPNVQEDESSVKDMSKKVNNGSELMAVEEDKYSALRELSTVESPQSNNTGSLGLIDDFGDFVTAEVSSDDPFTAISSRDSSAVNKTPITPPSVFDTSQTVEFPVDWTAFHSSDDGVSKAAPAVPSKSTSDTMDNIFNSLPSATFNTDELHLAGTSTSAQCSSSEFNEIDIFSSLKNLSLNTNYSTAKENVASVSNDLGLKINGKQCNSNDGSFPDCFQLGNNFNSVNSKDSPSKGISLSVFDEPSRTDILCSETIEDEFGDFVGTDIHSGEPSSCVTKEFSSDSQPSAATKDTLYDTHSVSSLEFPAFSLSRHGSLPSLDLKVYPSGSEQPGASHSQNVSPQAVEHQVTEWCRCVQSCLSLLQAALNLFSSVTSEEVLEEVLHIGEGKDYLNNLLEVYGVCQRVKQAFKLTSAESKKLESLLCEVDQVWDGLRVYYCKADIAVHQELPSQDMADNPVCGICLTVMEGGSGNTTALEYGGQLYHAACANLWVNCVECSLPSLANSLL